MTIYAIFILCAGIQVDPELPHNEDPTTTPTPISTSTKASEEESDEKSKAHMELVLERMLFTMMNTNLLFIFIVFLLILVILLVIFTCCWAWGCVRSLDAESKAEMYRQMRSPNPHQPIRPNGNANSR